MQREKATSCEFRDPELADPAAFGESPEPVDDGLPLQAAPSRTRAAVAMTAAAVRAAGGHASRGTVVGSMPAVLRPGG
jgi:hypothetical protein